jgi:hypothetical protein
VNALVAAASRWRTHYERAVIFLMRPGLLIIPIIQVFLVIGILVGFVLVARQAVLAVMRLIQRGGNKPGAK